MNASLLHLMLPEIVLTLAALALAGLAAWVGRRSMGPTSAHA